MEEEVVTRRRTANKFVIELETGIEWGTGSIEVPTGADTFETLGTNVATDSAVVAAGEWHVEEDTLIPAVSQVVEEMQSRVQLIEDLEGDTVISSLARWTVKTAVGDLVGGIGLYNDGSNVDFIVNADRFAVVPPDFDPDEDEPRIPFAVSGGIVYLDDAAIREASITSLKAADAFLTDLTAVHGTLATARIDIAEIWDLTINNRIQSVNFEDGAAGFLFVRDGTSQIPASSVIGVLKSSNYNGQDDPSSAASSEIGTVGWMLNKNGKMVVDLARVRGTLSAANIDSDVRNVRILWSGAGEIVAQTNESLGPRFRVAEDINNFDYLELSVVLRNEGLAGFVIADLARVPTFGSYSGSSISSPASPIQAFSYQGSSGAGGGFLVRIRRISSTQIRLWSLFASDEAWVYKIIGVRETG